MPQPRKGPSRRVQAAGKAPALLRGGPLPPLATGAPQSQPAPRAGGSTGWASEDSRPHHSADGLGAQAAAVSPALETRQAGRQAGEQGPGGRTGHTHPSLPDRPACAAPVGPHSAPARGAAQGPREPRPHEQLGTSWPGEGPLWGAAGGLWWPEEGEDTVVLSWVFIDGDTDGSSAAGGPAGTQGAALGLQQEGLRLQRTGSLRAPAADPPPAPRVLPLPAASCTRNPPAEPLLTPFPAHTPQGPPARPAWDPTLLSPAGSASTPVLTGHPGHPSPPTWITVLASPPFRPLPTL